MSNLLTSCSTQATTAPSFYNQYLSGLASKGMGAACSAQFVGASPLQQSAFNTACSATKTYQPGLQNAQAGACAALGMAKNCTPLSAANPYLHGATSCLGARTSALMNPYVNCVVRQIGTLGQQNIQQNVAPEATGAAVGSGQFGSQRGAQVLGQTLSNANQQILAQQACALKCGYKTALCGALKQGAICEQAGATAGNLASTGAQNLANIAKTGACIAATCQNLALNRLNALSTLGGTQRCIAQSQQLFPLTTLCKAAGLLRGYQIPTSTVNTSTVSPLGAALGTASAVNSLLCSKNGQSVASSILCGVKSLFNGSSSSTAAASTGNPTSLGTCFYNPTGWTCNAGAGGCSSGLYGLGANGLGCTAASCGTYGLGFAQGGRVGALCFANKGARPAR